MTGRASGEHEVWFDEKPLVKLEPVSVLTQGN